MPSTSISSGIESAILPLYALPKIKFFGAERQAGLLLVRPGVEQTRKQGTTGYIPQGGRQQIIYQKGQPTHLGAIEKGGGQKEHIGHAVLKAHGHKGHDRKPECQQFSGNIVGSKGGPHGQGHQPIGAYAFGKNHPKRSTGLLLCNIHETVEPGTLSKNAGLPAQQPGDKQRTYKVAQVNPSPVAQ